MNALNKIEINHNVQDTVDARQLHGWLESKRDFSNWVKSKVLNNPFFVENIDYILLNKFGEQTGRGGSNKKDYALTLDTAKKVSMAEQTEQGNKARDYFLECERKALTPFEIPNTLPDALRLAAELEEQRAILEVENKKLLPKAIGFDVIAASEGSLCFYDAAKALGMKPRKELIPLLELAGWIYRRKGSGILAAYQDKIDAGLMEEAQVVDADGVLKKQLFITAKGLTKIALEVCDVTIN